MLLNVAAWAAARRWAVGINGTHRPWKWGADLFAVHPLPTLIAHALVSAGLAWTLYRAARVSETDTAQAQRFVPESS